MLQYLPAYPDAAVQLQVFGAEHTPPLTQVVLHIAAKNKYGVINYDTSIDVMKQNESELANIDFLRYIQYSSIYFLLHFIVLSTIKLSNYGTVRSILMGFKQNVALNKYGPYIIILRTAFSFL